MNQNPSNPLPLRRNIDAGYKNENNFEILKDIQGF